MASGAVNLPPGFQLETPEQRIGQLDRPVSQQETLQGSPPLPGSLGARFMAGLAATPEKKQSYLEGKYGNDNVIEQGGEYYIQKDGNTYSLDPDNFGAIADMFSDLPGDVADVSGDIISAGPSVVGGFTPMGRTPFGQGLLGAAGETARQALSSAVPGSDDQSLGDQAMEVAKNAGIAAGSQYGFDKLGQLYDYARPTNYIGRIMNRAGLGETGTDATTNLAAANRAGIDLDPAQVTGDKKLESMTGFTRKNPFSAPAMQQFDDRQVQQAITALNSNLERLGNAPGSKMKIGQKVKESFDNTVDGLISRRRAQAADDFGLVDELSGNAPIVPVSNTVAAMDEIIERMDVGGAGGEATQSVVSQLKRIRDSLTQGLEQGELPVVTPSKLQRLMEIYGKGAGGTGDVLKDVDKAQQRGLAARIFSALKTDLDEVADAPGTLARNPEAAQALKAARDNYRRNSEPIERLKQNVLARVFGGRFELSPDKVLDKFKTMSGGEIRVALSALDDDTAQMVKAGFLNEGIQDAMHASPADEFSARRFVSWFKKNQDRLSGMLSPAEFDDVRGTFNALKRAALRSGEGGSETARWLFVADAANNMWNLANPLTLGKAAAMPIMSKTLAKAMTSREGRNAIKVVSNPASKTKAVGRAVTYLTALNASDQE